jgi:hypothetical protein
MRSRSARTLRLALDMLLPGIPVDVDCFALRRVPLSDNQRVALGVRNTILGNDLTIGRTVADRSGRFRVRIGPVDYERFEGLAPGGPMHAELAATINHFSGGVLEAEVELSLAADEAPQFQLGSQRGGILGRTTRLATKATEPIRSRFVLGERVGAQQLGDAGPPSRVPVLSAPIRGKSTSIVSITRRSSSISGCATTSPWWTTCTRTMRRSPRARISRLMFTNGVLAAGTRRFTMYSRPCEPNDATGILRSRISAF